MEKMGRLEMEKVYKTKKISIVIPTYNEEENIEPITEAVLKEMKDNLPEYDYEINFIPVCCPATCISFLISDTSCTET